MRSNIKLSVTALFILLAGGFSSCLKENYDNGKIQPTHSPDGTPQVIELGLTATSTESFYLLAVDNGDADTTVNFIPVRLAALAASQDIHVTLVQDAALINAYNGEHETAYEEAPGALYNIISSEVTIPKGSNTGYLKVKFKPSDFIGHDYAFGFRIQKVTESGYTISGNFNSGVAAITIKNEYDGIYDATGNFIHPNPDYTGAFDKDWECATSGTTAVTFQLNTTVLFGVYITFTVDPVTNRVALSREGDVLDPYDPALNYYDPAAKKFHYDFSYSGGTRRCTGTAVYKGPR